MTVDYIINHKKHLSVEVHVFSVTKTGMFYYVGNENHPHDQFRVHKSKIRKSN